MEYRKDIPKEGRNIIIVAILAIAFLLIANAITGQTLEVLRTDNYNEYLQCKTKRIYPKEALTFKASDEVKDSIFLSIMADSIKVNVYSIKLYAFFPKQVDIRGSKSITITFTDNTIAVFKMALSEQQGDFNYMEYIMDKNYYNHLRRLKIKSVEFEAVRRYKIYEDDLFKAFLNSYCSK